MENIVKIDSVRQYCDMIGVDTIQPMVGVIQYDKIPSVINRRMNVGIYAIFLKDVKCGNIIYGCNEYDYEDGTLVFVSPGQIYGIDSMGIARKPAGYGLVFHADLLRGTALASTIRNYNFFSYQVNEALHLSKKERQTIVDCLMKIDSEINQNIDKHSKTLIVSNIELLLNYCMRFYDRQFITRSNANKDILIRFEELLHHYFASGEAAQSGLPSVSWCARELHLSPNYFGDLINKETGSSALDYIQSKLIAEAKMRITDPTKSINAVSQELGFKYQQHFTRLFRQKAGMSPLEYRKQN